MTLWMHKNIIICSNAHACILKDPEVVISTKYDEHVNDMIAVTV